MFKYITYESTDGERAGVMLEEGDKLHTILDVYDLDAHITVPPVIHLVPVEGFEYTTFDEVPSFAEEFTSKYPEALI